VKGSRVQNVVQELRGEKIDIVPWDEDETRFVCNALAPAEVAKVLIDEHNHSMEIVVADNQLSLAIGRRGQNVKLASMLSGWKLDIVSETRMHKRVEDSKKLLMAVEGMNDTLAQSLYHYNMTVERLASADIAQLAQVPGFSEDKATEIKAGAAAMIASGKLAEMKKQMLEADKAAVAAAKTNSDAVFERLKAEVKAHAEKEKTEDAAAAAEAAKEAAPAVAAGLEEPKGE
jgi:transcription termination/antitermination protein NusA